MRVFLSGFMAAGKTTVGEALARRLGVPFVDLDASVVRREGRPIAEIFETDGEAAFRDAESRELSRAVAIEEVVVALGGGTLTREENRREVNGAGQLVWLDTPRSTILSRLDVGVGGRPLAGDRDGVVELFEERRPIYEDCDLHIRPGEVESPEEIASRIAEQLRR